MSETEDVQSAWGRIVHWLAVNAPVSAQALGGPATDEDIAGLREALGFDVPEPLEALLRMNNGSAAKDTTQVLPNGRVVPVHHPDSIIFPFGKVLLGSKEMAEERAKWLAAGDGPGDCWEPPWIPVVHDFERAYYGYAVDVSGASGFPVVWYVEAELPEKIAPSLGALLESFAEALERGSYEGLLPLVKSGVLRWCEHPNELIGVE